MAHEEFIRSAKRRKAFALFLTTGLAAVFGWLYAGLAGAFWAFAAWIAFVVLPRTTGMRPLGFIYRNFFVPQQLPWTMVNVVLAILVGSMQFGIAVAFYAALIGVPIVVLTLIVTVMEPDVEAEPIPLPARVNSQAPDGK
ncbi:MULTISPECIES: hypothetical protein [unclassified Sinorhizobium]|uniref:hypothetical protein n=1 Tax=unclassified Sinorhizobium TaxID=2613772 RepID=UPI0024C31573|nr:MULTISPECIES: hypothetical protein [unclassified Sinorhizobium]MDK1376799.1 hypothetical protein [Sinorhizobium sp. 6-70]MDK1479571.1 hypothetical protein [Sinorhizobium sp. 6-117]